MWDGYQKSHWIGEVIESPKDTLEYETKGHSDYIYMYIYFNEKHLMLIYFLRVCLEHCVFQQYNKLDLIFSNSQIYAIVVHGIFALKSGSWILENVEIPLL